MDCIIYLCDSIKYNWKLYMYITFGFGILLFTCFCDGWYIFCSIFFIYICLYSHCLPFIYLSVYDTTVLIAYDIASAKTVSKPIPRSFFTLLFVLSEISFLTVWCKSVLINKIYGTLSISLEKNKKSCQTVVHRVE